MQVHPSQGARVPAGRRGRRTLRAAAVATALVAVAAGVGLPAAPARAAVAQPSVRAVGGDHQVTAGWSAVSGAAGYTVRISTSSSMAGATAASTASLHKVFPGLVNGRRYYVRVTPTGLPPASTATSATVSATASGAVPVALTSVKVATAGANQVRVTWTGGGPMTKVAVLAGSTSTTEANSFSSPWLTATTRSYLLTVPADLRGVLGAGSGNHVFVKVVESNSADPTKYFLFNQTAKYRLSPPGTYAQVGTGVVAPAGLDRLRTASWNVQGLDATASYTTANQWPARLTRVVNTIRSVHPDLLGAQELGTARFDKACRNPLAVRTNPASTAYCREQYDDLRDALTDSYRLAAPPDVPPWYWIYQQPTGAYLDSMLFYDPAKLTMTAAGYLSPRTMGVSGWPATTDKAGMWAQFTVVGSGRRFIAASIHFPVDPGPEWEATRQDEARKVSSFLDGVARTTDGHALPIVLAGDLNGNGQTNPTAANLVFRANTFFDVASTGTAPRTGIRYATTNASNGTGGADSGYPEVAVMHPYATSRIDYILTKGAPYTFGYTNLVRVVPVAGTNPTTYLFDTRYNGSDHNMQVAEIGIGAPG